MVGLIKRKKGDEHSKAHFGHIFALAISPDGKYIASGGYDCVVKVGLGTFLVLDLSLFL